MEISKLTKFEPFPFIRPFGREFDWFFNPFGLNAVVPGAFEKETIWTPEVEMFTREHELVVRVDVPGLKREDVTIEVTPTELVLKGERKYEKEEKDKDYYRSERSYGSFYRVLPLPEGAGIDGAKAIVRNGVLEVTMPMKGIEARKRVLEITEPPAGENTAKKAA